MARIQQPAHRWFADFPAELHELLAQGLTYAVLQKLSSTERSKKLMKIFEALEVKQPSHYRLSTSVKQCAAQADWPLILDAVRGAIEVYREPDFTLKAGLEALIKASEKCT